MAGFDPIQTSFAGGELSRRLRGRVETELYQRGVELAENLEVLTHGPLLTKPGTEHVLPLQGGVDARLEEFRVAGGQSYILELATDALRVYSPFGVEESPGGGGGGDGANVVVNGDFSAGGESWVMDGPVSVGGGRCSLLLTWSRFDKFSEWEEDAGSIYQDVVAEAGLNRLSVAVTGLALGEVLGVMVSQGGVLKLSTTVIAAGAHAFGVELEAGPARVLFLIQSDIPPPTEIAITIDDVDLRLIGAGGGLGFASPWTALQIPEVQFVGETGRDRMFLFHPEVATRVLERAANGAWTFDLAAFVGAPAEWAGANWPGVGELFEGRLVVAATPAARSTIWWSRSGDPLNFHGATDANGNAVALGTEGAEVTADCSFSRRVATKGAVRWIRGQRHLLVGTDEGEHAITSQAGVLTPSDIGIRSESAWGSAALQARHIGDQVLYVSPDRRKIRALAYEYQTAGWKSRDVTFTGEHLTEDLVRELHFARDPNPVILAVLRSGIIACCTYDPAEQVAGWWRWTTNGVVLSAAVSNGPQGSIVWLSVQRANGVYLERMTFGESRRTVDAATVRAVPADRIITGLGHFEGQEVQILLDGAVETPQVVQGGVLTLEREGAEAIVGLGFRQRAVTLPPEGGNPRGTSQGEKRRRVKVALRLHRSALPLVDGKRIQADRTPATPMDTAESLFTGDAVCSTLGWTADGKVTIEQDLPLRTEILALFGSTQVNGL